MLQALFNTPDKHPLSFVAVWLDQRQRARQTLIGYCYGGLG